jgi:hypothetical protein
MSEVRKGERVKDTAVLFVCFIKSLEKLFDKSNYVKV